MSLDRNQEQWVRAILLALLFAIVSSPQVYKLVNMLTSRLGLEVCDVDGCPTPLGLAVHSVVFLLAARGVLEGDMQKLAGEQKSQ